MSDKLEDNEPLPPSTRVLSDARIKGTNELIVNFDFRGSFCYIVSSVHFGQEESTPIKIKGLLEAPKNDLKETKKKSKKAIGKKN